MNAVCCGLFSRSGVHENQTVRSDGPTTRTNLDTTNTEENGEMHRIDIHSENDGTSDDALVFKRRATAKSMENQPVTPARWAERTRKNFRKARRTRTEKTCQLREVRNNRREKRPVVDGIHRKRIGPHSATIATEEVSYIIEFIPSRRPGTVKPKQ